MSEPQRGEVWWADLGMAGKVRPVVVSASVAADDYALVAAVPHTTSEHPSRYGVPMKLPRLKEGVFNVQGLAPVPMSKFLRLITTLTPEQMSVLDSAVKRWLCLGE